MAIFLKLPEEKRKQNIRALQIRGSHNVTVVQSISSTSRLFPKEIC